jgi:hypothetical protein
LRVDTVTLAEVAERYSTSSSTSNTQDASTSRIDQPDIAYLVPIVERLGDAGP